MLKYLGNMLSRDLSQELADTSAEKYEIKSSLKRDDINFDKY